MPRTNMLTMPIVELEIRRLPELHARLGNRLGHPDSMGRRYTRAMKAVALVFLSC